MSAYPTLQTYAALAAGGIVVSNSELGVFNGYYGSSPDAIYTGTIYTSGSPNGRDSANAAAAQTQLAQMISDIDNLPVNFPGFTGLASGSTTYVPGVYESNTGISFGTGTVIDLDGQGNASSKFFFIAQGGPITFNDLEIRLINGAVQSNVFWLAKTQNITVGETSNIIGNLIANGAVSFIGFYLSVTGNVYSRNGTITFNSGGEVYGTQQLVVCYAKGTKILTESGYKNIEDIEVGDNLISKGEIAERKFTESNFVTKSVIWKNKFTVHNTNLHSAPICIKAGALGENLPFEDLYVSPPHSVLVDGKLVLARDMVNGETIFQDTSIDEITYYHIELDSHTCIVANGILAESYRDDSNRHAFDDTRLSVKLPQVSCA